MMTGDFKISNLIFSANKANTHLKNEFIKNSSSDIIIHLDFCNFLLIVHVENEE